ncbi:MAG: insulinase family protein [Xanthomonadaceae bacterium]|nr:insulinase family protein [Xanthomonadaceae bacterium]
MVRTLALILLSFISAGCQSELGTLKINWKRHTLSNGLRVVLVEDHSVPLISYQTWVGVGSVNEEEGKTGLAHFFEHLMFKGTEKYPGRKFFEKLEMQGAEVNASTSRDTTTFYENFSPHLLDTVIDLESDRFQNLLIDEERMQVEKAVVLEERKLRVESQPASRMQEALWSTVFRQHPYSHPVSGWPEDIIKFKTEDLKKFFAQYYTPKNVVIVVVGDLDSAVVIKKIEQGYGSWQDRSERKPLEIEFEPEQTGERRWTLTDGVTSEQLVMGYPISSADQKDSFVLDLLSGILFSGESSRAHQKCVEKEQLALSVSGSAYTPKYPGLFSSHVVMKPGISISKAEACIETLLLDFKKELVTQGELNRVRKQFLVSTLDGVKTPYGLGQWIGTVTVMFDDPGRFISDYQKYETITPEDIKRVAIKYFDSNQRSVITLTPRVAITKAK